MFFVIIIDYVFSIPLHVYDFLANNVFGKTTLRRQLVILYTSFARKINVDSIQDITQTSEAPNRLRKASYSETNTTNTTLIFCLIFPRIHKLRNICRLYNLPLYMHVNTNHYVRAVLQYNVLKIYLNTLQNMYVFH